MGFLIACHILLIPIVYSTTTKGDDIYDDRWPREHDSSNSNEMYGVAIVTGSFSDNKANDEPDITKRVFDMQSISFDISNFLIQLRESSNFLSTQGISAVSAAARVQLLNSYIDLVQNALEQLKIIDQSVTETNEILLEVMNGLAENL